jgi:hypothetical protein
MIKHNVTDGQGNPVVLNGAYKYIFAQPGNDTTVIIVKRINEDGTLTCFDVCFNFEINIDAEKLFKPLKFGFHPSELAEIKNHGGIV